MDCAEFANCITSPLSIPSSPTLRQSRWLIQAGVESGGGGTVTYTLKQEGDAIVFEREFIYRTPGWLFKLLDSLVIRRRIEGESEQALRNLKHVLESG